MEKNAHHEELVRGIATQLKPILDKSEQAVYIYLDDTHKICNKKFADLLGYKSVKEWVDTEAPLADVVEKDQDAVVLAYEAAMEKLTASNLDITLKNVKSGKLIKTRLILVPVVYDGHLFALHFISEK